MATNRLGGILRHLRRAVRPPGQDDTDAGLLERYLRQRDEAAFEVLVLRHGPMVFGVCRRVLGNEQDAEDAFQATFLVLARKGTSVLERAGLGAWLHGVAYRTALEARRAMARRRAKEARATPRAEAAAAEGDDLREVLDQELAALPERYRTAVVLCDLEGKGRQEAARELGCPEGTVASRLARGRALLAKRLARRGLAPAAAAALSQEAASACVPAALVTATVKAAALSAAGGAAGAVSANVLSLAERVVRIMLMVKLRVLTVVVLLVGTVGSGAGWLYHLRVAAAPPKAAGGAAAPAEEGDGSGPEGLREEVKRLQADLRRALERAAALEARLKGMEEEPQEVLYQGKPASYWCKLLKDRDPAFRERAMKALGSIARVDRAVFPVVAGALKDDDARVIGVAASEIAGIGKPAVPFLIEALKDPSQRDKTAVCTAIRDMGLDAAPAVPALLEVLKGSNPNARWEAAGALASIGPGARDAVPTLIALLEGRKENDHLTAICALRGIGRDARGAVPALIALLKKDPNSRVGQAALDALGGVGPEAREAVQPLIGLLKGKKDATYRCNVAVVLGEIGPDAKPAIPALLELLRDLTAENQRDVWPRVIEALERIDPETAAKVQGP